ncbi:MAG: hypothetical protein V4512_10900 [Pseudomonadota bacterium]
MDDQHDEPRGIAAALRARSGVVIALVGLVAWIALLWAMFGDVL